MTDIMDMVWSEKYRPQTLEDCVLTKKTRQYCESFIKDNELPNLLLQSNSAGTGKTTLAHVLCKEMGFDVLEINGSSDRNIDTLRGEITSFVSSFSISGSRKVVLIDEADYLNPTSTQPALRNFIQEFSSNCSFIFTCNYKNKIIEPLRSRFLEISFDFDPEDKEQLMVGMLKRMCYILDEQEIKYDKKVIAKYVWSYYPKFRDLINELQGVSKLGPIVKVVDRKAGNVQKILDIIKNRKFKDMRTWCAENSSLGIDWLGQTIFNNLDKLFENENQPLAIQLVYDYMYKDKFAVNPEICMAACLSEIFVSC